MDYKAAFKRPFTDVKKLSIGALLYMVPTVNILTGLFSSGYLIECSKKSKKGKLPEWDSWKKYLVNGLIMALISLTYTLPFIIITLVLLNLNLGNSVFSLEVFSLMAADPNGASQLLASVLWQNLILIMAVILALAYYTPMAMVSFANGKLKDAYNLKAITNKVFKLNYFLAWLAIMAYSVLINSLESGLSILLEHWIAIQILSSYLAMIIGVTVFTLYGQVFREK